MWSMKQPIGCHGCYMKRGKLGFSITRREQHLGVSPASRGRIFRIHEDRTGRWQEIQRSQCLAMSTRISDTAVG